MKLKGKAGIIIIISIVFVLIAVSAIIFFVSSYGYALKIDGEKISPAEFQVYLYEQKKDFYSVGGEDIWETDFDGVSAQEVAKQNAVNSVIYVKAAVNQAPELGITLSGEEAASVKQKGIEYRDKIKQEAPSIDLSIKEAEKIAREGLIQQKVYDFVTNGFEISSADFESSFNEYYEEKKAELNTVKIRYIFMALSEEDDFQAQESEANAIYKRLLKGEDFAAVQAELSDGEEVGAADVKELNLDPEVEAEAYNLDEGEVSRVIFTEKGYYIIKAEEVEAPDMEELKSEYKETYTANKKQEIYQSQLEKWAEKISVEKNEKVFAALSIDDI